MSYVGDSFRFDWGVDRYGWEDAGGKVQLEARRLGQVCTFWVPSQPGYEHPQMLRSHLGKVEGTIDGEAVEGLFMLDYIYSRPDAMWSEMGMLTKLHNIWLNWLVEYEDGSLEGGYAWRGRPGTGFAAAHHFVDGASRARSDAVIVEERTERGTISTPRAAARRPPRRARPAGVDRLAAATPAAPSAPSRTASGSRRAGTTPSASRSTGARCPTTRPCTTPSTGATRRSSA